MTLLDLEYIMVIDYLDPMSSWVTKEIETEIEPPIPGCLYWFGYTVILFPPFKTELQKVNEYVDKTHIDQYYYCDSTGKLWQVTKNAVGNALMASERADKPFENILLADL